MINDASVTIAGNITADPELRFTRTELPVASFNVAHTPRRLNRETNVWVDAGDTLFLRVNVWRDQAENIAASLQKGAAVIVIGKLVTRSWKTAEGDDRSSVECEAEIVSLDLRRQRISGVTRVRRDAPAPDPAADSWAPADTALRSTSKAAAA